VFSPKHRGALDPFQGFGTRRPSNQEAFCKGLEGAAQRFICDFVTGVFVVT